MCMVKMKFVMVLLLVIIILGTFIGCEPLPSLPTIVTTMKGYNNEIVALILSQVEEEYSPDDFPEGTTIPLDEGITCTVDYSGAADLELILTLNNWAAGDGTEINGLMSVEIEYQASPVAISSISVSPAMLYFDRTSVSYVTEALDGDASSEAFTSEERLFVFISLIVDGKTLISNLVGL